MGKFAPVQRFHVAIVRDVNVTSDFILSKWEIQQLKSGLRCLNLPRIHSVFRDETGAESGHYS